MTVAPPRRLRRALVVLPSAALGGAEAVTAALLRALHAAGVELDVAVEPGLRAGLAAMLGPALADAVTAAPVGWREDEPAERNLRRQAAVVGARLAAGRPPDAAILPLPWPSHGLGALEALRAAEVPTLAVAHLAPRDEEEVEAVSAAARAVPPAALLRPGLAWTAVAAPTAARVEAALGLPRGRVAVVPNGVPVPRVRPGEREAARAAKRAALRLRHDAPLLAFAGRLEPKKGADLLPALALALGRPPVGATVVALGDGPARPLLAAHEAAGGEPPRATAAAAAPRRAPPDADDDARPRPPLPPLRLLGRVADVGDWLLAADALLLPSRLEGCPLVFLEAAARRCPVVAAEAALEALGDAAWDVAAVAPGGTVSALADQAAAVLTAPEDDAGRRLRIEAAFRHAVAWDEAAMLRRAVALLRAAAAAAADAPAAAAAA